MKKVEREYVLHQKFTIVTFGGQSDTQSDRDFIDRQLELEVYKGVENDFKIGILRNLFWEIQQYVGYVVDGGNWCEVWKTTVQNGIEMLTSKRNKTHRKNPLHRKVMAPAAIDMDVSCFVFACFA